MYLLSVLIKHDDDVFKHKQNVLLKYIKYPIIFVINFVQIVCNQNVLVSQNHSYLIQFSLYSYKVFNVN